MDPQWTLCPMCWKEENIALTNAKKYKTKLENRLYSPKCKNICHYWLFKKLLNTPISTEINLDLDDPNIPDMLDSFEESIETEEQETNKNPQLLDNVVSCFYKKTKFKNLCLKQYYKHHKLSLTESPSSLL